MFKLGELVYCIISILAVVILGFLVRAISPDFQLLDIALLKVFYIALLNVSILSFLTALRARGRDRDVITGLWVDPRARAIFIAGYAVAVALVIGK